MASTKKVLTSLHGKRVGLSQRGDLIVNGRTVTTTDDNGSMRVIQASPATLNATGTLTIAQLLNGIVTSTTAAAVAATLPLGTSIEAESALTDGGLLQVDESFRWNVINTGGANAFTLQANTGHTIVGNAAVAASSSAEFLTRKTAANTYVTYRL